MVTIQEEKWADVVPEMRPLWELHWREMALDQDSIKIDMDVEKYAQMDALGLIHVTTVRDAEKLVGYVICFVIRHMHYYRAGEMALADMYWIRPEYRRGNTGIRLFREMERALQARGVIRCHMSCKVHLDMTKLFERLGYKKTDFTFSKMLKGAPCQ